MTFGIERSSNTGIFYNPIKTFCCRDDSVHTLLRPDMKRKRSAIKHDLFTSDEYGRKLDALLGPVLASRRQIGRNVGARQQHC